MWEPKVRPPAMLEYDKLLRARAAELEQAHDSVSVDRRLETLGVPYDVRAALRAPRETGALVAARAFVADSAARWLLLVGVVGVGKTVAAAHVLAEFAKEFPWNSQPSGPRPPPAMFCEAHRLTTVSSFERADQVWLDQLEHALLLVVDDLGDEGTDIGRGLLVKTLLARHAANRRTVLTTNLTREAFKQRYGEALTDRIRSAGMVPALVGRSLRERRTA